MLIGVLIYLPTIKIMYLSIFAVVVVVVDFGINVLNEKQG